MSKKNPLTENVLIKSEPWQALWKHQKEMANVHLQELFADKNGNRAEQFCVEAEDFLLDYSKNHLNAKTLDLLFNLATTTKLEKHRMSLFKGDAINWTEGRSVLHTALRLPDDVLDGKVASITPLPSSNVLQEIRETRQKIKAFVEKVKSGKWLGCSGKAITDVVNIGIGGSDLGPKAVYEALKFYANKPNVHFVSNVDESDLRECLKKLNPDTTLFLIASKTFTTQETMTNAKSAKAWFEAHLNNTKQSNAISKHFAAMSTNISACVEFGIDEANIFPFGNYVGGRYSVWSSIGLSVALGIGFENFSEFLAGGHDMDAHFYTTPFSVNMPVLFALIGIWYNNFFNTTTQAVLPYSQYLKYFPAYLQQLEMESNGKSVDNNNEFIFHSTCPIVWGDVGTNGQHAFYQLMHQGSACHPADFIAYKESLFEAASSHQQKLLANFIAQTEALAFGQSKEKVEKVMKQAGSSSEEINKLIHHKTFLGNRPTTSLLIDKLTPRSIGKLLALYEHKVFVQGIIWRINSFDQWGVELGKTLAKNILATLQDPITQKDEKIDNYNNSSSKKLTEACKSHWQKFSRSR